MPCLLGKKLGVPHTIARVRNPEYYEQINELKEELGLSMTVNPEFAAATEILRLLALPLCFENRGVCERACGTGRGQDSAPQCAGWDASMGDL